MEAEMRQKLQRVRRRRGSLVSHSAMAREDMPTIPLALALVRPVYALDAHAAFELGKHPHHLKHGFAGGHRVSMPC
jgi:hypothetical protein